MFKNALIIVNLTLIPSVSATTNGFPDDATYSLFANKCLECHSGPNVSINFSKAPLLMSGKTSPTAILDSILSAVSGEQPRMPPGYRPRLTEQEIDLIKSWKAALN